MSLGHHTAHRLGQLALGENREDLQFCRCHREEPKAPKPVSFLFSAYQTISSFSTLRQAGRQRSAISVQVSSQHRVLNKYILGPACRLFPNYLIFSILRHPFPPCYFSPRAISHFSRCHTASDCHCSLQKLQHFPRQTLPSSDPSLIHPRATHNSPCALFLSSPLS